ncbi:Gram-negative bacterial tonB protein [Rivularia sp. PCC 7116]|uniref:energy transducer TonB n=1 Tax=Rivularia sp. PCC 7116 TaxID=373994 RepID=UPI00029F0839|nr:energy transducer TonB [Rivularia sp. PCC 7116]AFY58741.1 Gram-negative bacterial tonB protein [Rivularia sp. PCC 7116]
MSYVSVLKNIPEFLSQPAGIAAIASVGIHGAIAFILPLMPVDSKPKEKASPASVGIMELSEAEQNRLPQSRGPQISALPRVPSQPGIPLPNFATQPTPLARIPGNPDSTKVILPPLPRSSGNPSLSALPQPKSLPILPQPNFKVDSSFNAKAKSGGSSYRRYNQNFKLGNPTPLVSRRNRSSRKSAASVPNNIPPIQSAQLPAGIARIPAPPPLPPMGNPGISNGNSVAINSQISPNNNTSVNQPVRVSPEDFIAPTNRNIPKPGDKLTFAGQNVQQWGQQQSGNRRILLPNQPSGNTTGITAPQNSKTPTTNTTTLALARQFNEVKQRYPNFETKEPISDVIKTKPGKEGKVEGTLVIDSDGKVDYLKYVDRSVASKLNKETRNYIRNYFKKNPIRKNGKAKVYAFTLDFKSDAANSSVEFSKPKDKLIDRLRDAKDKPVQIDAKPSQKKPENVSRSSAPVKIDVKPSPGAVVVPTQTSTPVKLKQPVEIRTRKPASPSASKDKLPVEIRLRNQEVPKVPSKPKPQARVNTTTNKPTPQVTSKPSLANRLRNIKKDSDENSEKDSDSKKLIQRLRKIQERRENSN